MRVAIQESFISDRMHDSSRADAEEVDMDLDGVKDLFVFDRMGDRILTFLNGILLKRRNEMSTVTI